VTHFPKHNLPIDGSLGVLISVTGCNQIFHSTSVIFFAVGPFRPTVAASQSTRSRQICTFPILLYRRCLSVKK
jgi:hypothetical protein